jgi:hypothetical protein
MGGVLTLSLVPIFPAALFGLGRGIYSEARGRPPYRGASEASSGQKAHYRVEQAANSSTGSVRKACQCCNDLRSTQGVSGRVVEAQPSRFLLGTTLGFQYLASIRGKSKVGDYQEDWRVRAQRTTRRNIDPNGQKRELFGLNPRCAKRIEPSCTEFKGKTRLSRTTEED